METTTTKPKQPRISVLTGAGGGGGNTTITGRVSLNKVHRAGDVLVTRMTSPVQLADMLKASAIITDQGGEMCHAAVVCRAEGIPYVIGTRSATRRFITGMEVTVDPVNKTVTYAMGQRAKMKKEAEAKAAEAEAAATVN